MSATGIYVGQPEQWLLGHRTAVLAAIRESAGGRIASVSGAAKSLSRLHMTPDQLRDELREVNHALNKLNPDTYPLPPRRGMMRASFSTTAE